ncbi:MAG: hypothetical protein IJ061_03360 [Lachnospiraceae bacterium]|nr:hypothetical protein [Lachnospiraceae bacterium]
MPAAQKIVSDRCFCHRASESSYKKASGSAVHADPDVFFKNRLFSGTSNFRQKSNPDAFLKTQQKTQQKTQRNKLEMV